MKKFLLVLGMMGIGCTVLTPEPKIISAEFNTFNKVNFYATDSGRLCIEMWNRADSTGSRLIKTEYEYIDHEGNYEHELTWPQATLGSYYSVKLATDDGDSLWTSTELWFGLGDSLPPSGVFTILESQGKAPFNAVFLGSLKGCDELFAPAMIDYEGDDIYDCEYNNSHTYTQPGKYYPTVKGSNRWGTTILQLTDLEYKYPIPIVVLP